MQKIRKRMLGSMTDRRLIEVTGLDTLGPFPLIEGWAMDSWWAQQD